MAPGAQRPAPPLCLSRGQVVRIHVASCQRLVEPETRLAAWILLVIHGHWWLVGRE